MFWFAPGSGEAHTPHRPEDLERRQKPVQSSPGWYDREISCPRYISAYPLWAFYLPLQRSKITLRLLGINANRVLAVNNHRLFAFPPLALLLLIPASLLAEPVMDFANADLLNGEEINEVCAGCHGQYGEGGKEGEYPRVAGLPAAYIAKEMVRFRERSRPNMPMVEHVDDRQMPDNDIRDISVYLANIRLLSKLPPIKEGEEFDAHERLQLTKHFLNIARIDGDHEAGRKLYNRECKSCHGKDGEGKESQAIPMLAGQYTNYLKRSVKKYIDKVRIHDEKAPEEKFLSLFSEKELSDILAYLTIIDD